MQQDITHISFDRMSRFFTGSQAQVNMGFSWQEVGDFIEGVTIRLRRVRRKDGLLRFRMWGFSAEGQMEPAQNLLPDYKAYGTLLNGTKNIAFLTGDELWIFRLRDTGRKEIQDNRLSIVCDPGYGGTMKKSFAEISGFIRSYEHYKVKNFQLGAGGKLQYTIVESLFVDGMDVPVMENIGS